MSACAVVLLARPLVDEPLPRHVANRPPRGIKVSWGRYTLGHDDRVCYRLFRREIEGKLHMESRTFAAYTSRATVARVLWDMRKRLREAVDLLDLQTLGLL